MGREREQARRGTFMRRRGKSGKLTGEKERYSSESVKVMMEVSIYIFKVGR
jgi:hypothetical protein